jgi:hypothetical protein
VNAAAASAAKVVPIKKAGKKKAKKQKKKKRKKDIPLTQEEIEAAKRAHEEEERRAAEELLQLNRGNSYSRYHKLALSVGVLPGDYIPSFTRPKGLSVSSAASALDGLFNLSHKGEPLWCLLDDSASSQILKSALKSAETLPFFRNNASHILEAFSSTKVRQHDITVLLTARLTFSAKSVSVLFSNFEKDRAKSFNNNTANSLATTNTIKMESKADYKLVMDSIAECLGKKAKSDIIEAMKHASKALLQSKQQTRRASSPSGKIDIDANGPSTKEEEAEEPDETNEEMERKALEEMERKLAAMSIQGQKITSTYQWYTELLKEIERKAPKQDEFDRCDDEDAGEAHGGADNSVDDAKKKAAATFSSSLPSKKQALTSDQLVAALTSCETEDALADIEMGIDLLHWDSMSPWIIDITEHAHKFFRRHIKKDRALCERVIRRLMMLSTGRW